MKVEITAVQMFNVDIGGCDIGPFRCASTWNGMSELINDAGHKIIIEKPSTFSALFAEVFDQSQEVTVVTASPQVLEKMIKDTKAGAA